MTEGRLAESIIFLSPAREPQTEYLTEGYLAEPIIFISPARQLPKQNI